MPRGAWLQIVGAFDCIQVRLNIHTGWQGEVRCYFHPILWYLKYNSGDTWINSLERTCLRQLRDGCTSSDLLHTPVCSSARGCVWAAHSWFLCSARIRVSIGALVCTCSVSLLPEVFWSTQRVVEKTTNISKNILQISCPVHINYIYSLSITSRKMSNKQLGKLSEWWFAMPL